MVQIKRAYDPPEDGDGKRILVDRMWPRGVSKENAHLDRWAREISPSAALCKWFGHDPAKWGEFQARYNEELKAIPGALAEIAEEAKSGPVTLVYGARDREHNQAVVLKAAIEAASTK